jgi:anhydro-N-acetylmuramic acid kinase
MGQDTYTLIGLMSGTSGDGLDIAYVRFQKNKIWTFEIEKAQTYQFPEGLGKKLLSAHLMTAMELSVLDVSFGRWMGEKVLEFCEDLETKPQAVASHGHTVFHQPHLGLSLQIGNGWALHVACGLPVINDFRMLDIQLGGQGAPLVPIGDQLLFPKVDFCINLGGISNISFEKSGKRLAFDMSPFNILLNAEANKLGLPFDNGGIEARKGELNLPLFNQLNNMPFYAKKGAKSLGREDMETDFSPAIRRANLGPRDAMRTLVEHFAFQIAQVIRKNQEKENPQILLTGGGAYHILFEERLSHYLSHNWEKYQATEELIEFKEALIFAFLGVLRLRGENNCLASVTGAREDSCGGTLYP